MSAQDKKQYIDVDDALTRVRGNKKLYCRMLKMLLDSQEFDKLNESFRNNDFSGAEHAAHSIKGITGNLSLPLLFDESVELLRQIREHDMKEETFNNFQAIWLTTKTYVAEEIANMENQ